MIMKAHGTKAIDICKKCDLKRPYLSKMISGTLIPSTYEIVERIIGSMDMSLDEKELLTDAYQLSVSSEADKQLWRSFRQVYSLSYPAKKYEVSPMDCPPENGAILEGRQLDAAAEMILNEASGAVSLFFCATSAEVAERLSGSLSRLPEDRSLDWLMPLNSSKEGNDSNFTLMVNAFPMFCSKAVRVLKQEENIPLLLKNPFPFYILSDTQLLLLDESMEKGQYFSDPATVRLYRENFDKRASEATGFLDSFDRADLSLTVWRRSKPLSTVHPCGAEN